MSQVAGSTTREMAARAAARQTLQSASLAPRARALRGSARSTRTVMSQVARSTTGGAAWARRTGMTAFRKRTGMTAASKRTGASSVGFFNNCLADDLGSMSTVPFGCLLLSLPIRVAHGVPFWRGFLGDSFQVHVY